MKRYLLDPPPLSKVVEHKTKGTFLLHCDNSRRRGGKPVRECDCEGVQFSSGHVFLDTEQLPVKHFLSMQQMVDTLSEWGIVAVVWDGEEEKEILT